MERQRLLPVVAVFLCLVLGAKSWQGFVTSSLHGMEALTIAAQQAVYGDLEGFRRERVLQMKKGNTISYDSLRKDFTPCAPQTGQAYYSNCKNNPTAVNSYKMDCTKFNRCARDTK
uniref:Uncharacterized protein n=1 Tax=Araucaria cunninghamii TaxID=56994 RepID=A0A0D6R5Z3_ARACU